MENKNLMAKIKIIAKNKKNDIYSIIAVKLIENLTKIETLTIGELAKLSFCSTASIVKFAKTLNLNGYKELVRILSFEYNITKNFKNEQTENIDLQLNEYANIITENIKYINLNWNTALKKSAILINKASKIYLFGRGPNVLICNLFANYLFKLNKNCFFSTDIDVQEKLVKQTDENCVCVFISFSGLTRKIIDFYNIVIENKAKVINISGNPLSPMFSERNINIFTLQNEEIMSNQTSAFVSFSSIIMKIVYLLVKENT